MNGTRTRLENPMAPDPHSMAPESHPTAKRKADESNPLLHAAKRSKKEGKPGASKRKLVGEEQPGGLFIVRARAASPQQSSSQPVVGTSSQPVFTNSSQPVINTTAPPRAHSRPPPSSSQPTPGPSKSKPPSKKFKAESSRAATKAKVHDGIPTTTREDPELDEDVRQMEDETDHLRRRSRAKETVNPEFQFPPSKPPSQRHTSDAIQRHLHDPLQRRPNDALQPLAESETPQIERNKLMREGLLPLPRARTPQPPPPPLPPQTSQHEHSRHTPQHSRRSSMSMRGKRISTSFETTGVISQPHTSVNDSSFYKHIDCDLPDPQRARQLLIWSAARAIAREREPSSSTSKSKSQGKDPPPLPPLDAHLQQILQAAEEDVIRLLAEKKIDTSVYSHGHSDDAGGDARNLNLKPNEQNVKNRAREVKFREDIERAKAESDAWAQVDQFYNTYDANSRADLEKRRQALNPPTSSRAHGKGKQRAASQEREQESPDEDDDWSWLLPHPADLSPDFRERVDLEVVKRVMTSRSKNGGSSSALDERMKDMQFKVDSIFSYVNSAMQTTNVAEAEFDHRYSLLSLALNARTRSVPPPSAHSPTSLSSHLPLPPRAANHDLRHDPQDIFRALSRIDKERPPGEVGDAARRAAREVQRVQEGGGVGVGERRLTGVVATPRKAPGTPRRKDR
ncbi:hypothetical protein BV22DRAFT_1083444 [Leucogyrophana mollusca]|uniref:Uncharacterized protein n=1 Tax=Leucogyrophana mollusca TaxID=85980 RepID=A0ACB8BQT9_9AGAM|nr:hypothetical protein BV22DRAFT_1083444 [Leucogyrophana mollusca]